VLAESRAPSPKPRPPVPFRLGTFAVSGVSGTSSSSPWPPDNKIALIGEKIVQAARARRKNA